MEDCEPSVVKVVISKNVSSGEVYVAGISLSSAI
jgi:hypothetical protein